MRNELIDAAAKCYSVWTNLQGQEFAWERGWLKPTEEKKYFEEKELWDTNMKICEKLIPEIKQKFPNEVVEFAESEYERLSTLIKSKTLNKYDLDDARCVRRNWSAISKGKRTPFNEFWAWAVVPDKY